MRPNSYSQAVADCRSKLFLPLQALADLVDETVEEKGSGDFPPGRRAEDVEPEEGPARLPPAQMAPTAAAAAAALQAGGVDGGDLTPAELADIKRAVQDAPPTPVRDKQQHQVVSIAPEAQQTWSKGLARCAAASAASQYCARSFFSVTDAHSIPL